MLKIGNITYPSLKGRVSDEEWDVRVQTAALFRLIPLLGWDDLSMQLVSARIGEHFLVGPSALLFEEVTASSLVKITLDGEIVGDTPFSIIASTWYPMRGVHEARPDANFVIHSHDDYIAAVACNTEGLLPISQPAAFAMADGLAYHDYEGVETYAERIPGLQRALGATNHAVLLRSHGLLTLGYLARQAFLRHYNLRKACRIQILAGGARHGELIKFPQALIDSFQMELLRLAQGDGTTDPWDGLLRKLAKLDPGFMD